MNLQEVRDYAEALAKTPVARTTILDFELVKLDSLTEFVVRENVSVKQHLADVLMRSAAVRGFRRNDATEYRINSVLREELTSAVKALMLISDQNDVFSVRANANGAGTMYLVGIDMISKPGKEKSVELAMDNGDAKCFCVQTEGGYHYFRALAPCLS